jgi:hypothetical protein
MRPVPHRLVYPIAWAVATAVTVGIAWLGIRSVLVAAAPNRISPISAADLRKAAPIPSPAPPPTPSPSPPPSPPASTKPPSTGPDAWVPVPDPSGGTAFRRTFRTGGGEVVVLSARAGVKIEATRPKTGFTVTTARQSDQSVIVSFIGQRRASRVWARWNNGPYAEVTEVTGFST